jgi:hypothetical protein
MHHWTPIDLEKVQTQPLSERTSKVDIQDFAQPWKPGGSMSDWFRSLPKILAAGALRDIAARIVQASASGKTVLLAMGAHTIKVGLNPVIADLLERGILTGIAMNGAGIIHDAELAMVGHTSEDVAAGIDAGRFGMTEETGRFLNAAIKAGAKERMGLGRAVGSMLTKQRFPYTDRSLLAKAYELDIPLTVHVAIGTDVIHCHPNVDAAAIGSASHMDFRLFARLVSTLEEGVFLNLGSSVIMPEVFLKALSLARNLGSTTRNFTTVNMDFISHYRPMTNVVQRPVSCGGRGYNLIGHHEIMFPLLAAAVIESLEELDR